MNKDEITKAVDTLASAVKAEQEADDVLKVALTAYAEEFTKWQEEHSDLVASLDTAKVECTEAIRAKSVASKVVREVAPPYFEGNPEARNDTPGLSYRLERKPVIGGWFVEAAVKAGATFLLKPDDKAIKKFIQGMAVQEKITKVWELPPAIIRWLDTSLTVKNDYVVTIAEDKLVVSESERKA